LKRQSLAHLHLRNWMSIQIAKHIKLARDGSKSPAKEDNRTIFMVSILHHCRMLSTEGSLRPNCWHLSRLMGTLNMWCLERIFSTYQRLNIINASENGTGLHSYHPLDVAIHLECGYGWRTRTCDDFLLFVVTPQEINLIKFQPDRHQSQLLNIQFMLLLLKSPCLWV
jgi:hypothetical protein